MLLDMGYVPVGHDITQGFLPSSRKTTSPHAVSCALLPMHALIGVHGLMHLAEPMAELANRPYVPGGHDHTHGSLLVNVV